MHLFCIVLVQFKFHCLLLVHGCGGIIVCIIVSNGYVCMYILCAFKLVIHAYYQCLNKFLFVLQQYLCKVYVQLNCCDLFCNLCLINAIIDAASKPSIVLCCNMQMQQNYMCMKIIIMQQHVHAIKVVIGCVCECVINVDCVFAFAWWYCQASLKHGLVLTQNNEQMTTTMSMIR